MGVIAFNPKWQTIGTQFRHQCITVVCRFNPLANGATCVTDKMWIAIKVGSAIREIRSVIQRCYLCCAELFLTLFIFFNAKSPKGQIAGLAQIC